MKTVEKMLNEAGRNNYGFYEVTPGTDMARRLSHLTENAIKTMIKRGYIKKVGSGLVLTQDGYGC